MASADGAQQEAKRAEESIHGELRDAQKQLSELTKQLRDEKGKNEALDE